MKGAVLVGVLSLLSGALSIVTKSSKSTKIDESVHTDSKLTHAEEGAVKAHSTESAISFQLLYNLTADPTEHTNLLNTGDDWDDTVAFFEDRVTYWTQFFQQPQIADADPTLWFKYGVGPWEESDFVIPTIEQKYFYENAPHIVYVLIDDWGYNDLGMRSTFMNWTTPNIDKLIRNDGVLLTDYYTNELCAPSRGSLLTGRYAFRIGFQNATNENFLASELGLEEVTIAQELKSAGYRTYGVGKWGVGVSTTQSIPSNRGFDYFYGYWQPFVDYWKKSYGNFADLHENEVLVTDADALDPTYHAGYLYEAKAEEVLRQHSINYPTTPLFLYYAMQLVHTPYEAPQSFMERCALPENDIDDAVATEYQTYCAMNAMLDEAIGNLTCTLSKLGMSENTVLILASDNGGDKLIAGNSVPWKGAKGSYFKGGVAGTAAVISDLIPKELRGTEYSGKMHITDWLPTLMHVATNGEWTGGYFDQELDGLDIWDGITTGAPSPRREIVHIIGDEDGNYAALVYDDIKYMKSFNDLGLGAPLIVFTHDTAPENAQAMCEYESYWELVARDHEAAILAGAVSETSASETEKSVSAVADTSLHSTAWLCLGVAAVLIVSAWFGIQVASSAESKADKYAFLTPKVGDDAFVGSYQNIEER